MCGELLGIVALSDGRPSFGLFAAYGLGVGGVLVSSSSFGLCVNKVLSATTEVCLVWYVLVVPVVCFPIFDFMKILMICSLFIADGVGC